MLEAVAAHLPGGFMSLVPRRSRRPILLLAMGLSVLGLAIRGSAHAGVRVVRSHGSGAGAEGGDDVRTLKAGVDAVLGQPTESEPDTLLVQPGFYEEDVSMESTRS